jgi:hypothetical protein
MKHCLFLSLIKAVLGMVWHDFVIRKLTT